MPRTTHPPTLARRILALFSWSDERSSILADFEEMYMDMVQREGRAKANRWYWSQVLKSIPMFVKNLIYWRTAMLKNYLKIAIRNMVHNRVYSFIVIFGFSLGLACFVLITAWITNEVTYDRIFPESSRIYKVDADANFGSRDLNLGSQTNYTGPMLHKDMPEVEDFMRVQITFDTSLVRGPNNLVFREHNIFRCDRNFFDFFPLPMIQGNPSTALADPASVVISKETAQKYFPNSNPLGQNLEINGTNHHITGVVDIKKTKTHLFFDFLQPLPKFSFKPEEYHNLNLAYLTYVRLTKECDTHLLEEKATPLVIGYFKPVTDAIGLKNFKYRLILRPLYDIYLHSSVPDNFRSGSQTNIYIMLAVALIILFIVAFNYMNLTLAKGLLRTKEVGLRKIVGASKNTIRTQLMGETFLQTILAFILALLLARLVLPAFIVLTGKNLAFFPLIIHLLPLYTIILILVVLFSGFYPAIYLARMDALELLHSKYFSGKTKPAFRRIIVIVQFALAIILISATLFIAKQVDYMKAVDLGFAKHNRLVLDLANSDYVAKHQVLIRGLSAIPGIKKSCVSSTVPGKFGGTNAFNVQGDSTRHFLWMVFTDYEFLPTYGLELLKGRNFSRDLTTDRNSSVIINETAARKMGLDDPIGKIIEDQSDKTTYTIIGLIKDYHNESLHQELKPLFIRNIYSDTQRHYAKPRFLSLVIDDNQAVNTLVEIEKKFKSLISNQYFEYFFIEDLYDSFYEEEDHFNRIFLYASILAIFLSCLGLFGLTMFIVQRKTKEIGIRKVIGATVVRIFMMLSRDFAGWIISANLIAWPVAYIALSQWLKNFAYRTSIDIWIFIVAGMCTMLIALITVSYLTVKASSANPATALKYE